MRPVAEAVRSPRSVAHTNALRGHVVFSALAVFPSLIAGFPVEEAIAARRQGARTVGHSASDIEAMGHGSLLASPLAVLGKPITLPLRLAVVSRRWSGLTPPLRFPVTSGERE